MIDVNILLIDVDSKYGNLALANISAYYKSKGDDVGFNIKNPDKVYISCIFSKNKAQTKGISTLFPNSEIYMGGSGISWDWLPNEMQKIKPDYDLYNWKHAIGFTTRGCFRRCPWCVVPDKEGRFQKWMHIKEFWDDRFDTVELLDNQWLQDKKWFFENTDFILDNNLKVRENGMDIRLLGADSGDIAERLSLINFTNSLHFSWDELKNEIDVEIGLRMLESKGIDLKHDVQVYVLVGFNTTIEEDKYRCRKLKKLGTNAFIMPFIKNEWTKFLAHWGNRKHIYWSCDIDDFYCNGKFGHEFR